MEMNLQRLSDVKGLIPSRGIRRKKEEEGNRETKISKQGSNKFKTVFEKIAVQNPTDCERHCSSNGLPFPESLGRPIFL